MADDVFRCYERINFSEKRLKVIAHANRIIKGYGAQGLVLTVRQLYYQFVQQNLHDNTKRSYDRFKSTINDARIAGLISWTAIEDRTRNVLGHTTYESPKQAILKLGEDYKRDLWLEQEWRPEVWIEKEALIGVIDQICSRLRVDFFACKGYNSQSEQWRAGQRFAQRIRKGQRPIVFHLGDHDPSGLDMTRDNRKRLTMFAGTEIIVERLALNMRQIEELGPPKNPAKLTDSRIDEYKTLYGRGEDHPDGPLLDSWELDALNPSYLSNLIETAIMPIRDETKWAESLAREVEERRVISDIGRDLEIV